MTSVALTNAGKHVTSNNDCTRYKRYTADLVFWLVQTTLCVMTLLNVSFCCDQTSFQKVRQRVVDMSIMIWIKKYLRSVCNGFSPSMLLKLGYVQAYQMCRCLNKNDYSTSIRIKTYLVNYVVTTSIRANVYTLLT